MKKVKKAQNGGKIDYSYLLNPKNLGVENYSDEGSFNKAFEKAKRDGHKEFIWNGKRFNTKSNLSGQQQLDKYGITDRQLSGRNKITERAYRTVDPYYFGSSSEGYQQFLDNQTRTPRPERPIERDGMDREYQDDFGLVNDDYKPIEDAWSLYTGHPQRYNSLRISKYKPSKSTDPNAEYYAVNNLPELDSALERAKALKVGEKLQTNGLEQGSNKLQLLLRNFSVGKGKDDKGEFVYYYDNFNLNPSLEFPMPEQGQSFDIYDRIYLNNNKTQPEYKNGGKIMKKNKTTKYNIKAQQGLAVIDPNSYTASSVPGAMYETNPTFKDKASHDAHYRQQAINKMRSGSPELFQRYSQLVAEGNNIDADAVIMAAGGIPTFTPIPQVIKPSRILNIDYKPKKTKGYRYESAQGKPDIESITKYEGGGIIKDNMGQWAHPGKVTQIDSNNITMKGVNYPILGISDTGDKKMMLPEQDYTFNGNKVTEFPIMQKGGKTSKGKPTKINNEEISKSRINAVKDLQKQGITDSNKILNYLNYLEDGTKVGDFTLDEINKYLNNKNFDIQESEISPIKLDSIRNDSIIMNKGFHTMPDGTIMSNAEMAKSGIHIKESKKGTFTAAAKKRGKGVQAFAQQVMANKENYSPAMVKKANFARNAAKWKKGQDGLQLDLSPQQQLDNILLKNALLQERTQKRDSVMYDLRKKYPESTGQINQGMLKYYETEPKEYLRLDINLLDDNRKKELTQKFGKKYQFGGQFSMDDLPQQGATQIQLDNPYQSQGTFDPFYGQQYQNIPQGQQSKGSNFYNNTGGMQGIAQGVGSLTSGFQEGNQEGQPSGAQRAVGSFGPWGAAISQVSQLGTNFTDKSNSEVMYTAGKTIFDPASAWTNKDLSSRDRILGGLNPIYGGIKAFRAKKEKERKQKELDRIVQEAGASRDIQQRRYVRPEDQIVDPNELYPSYGTGTNYLKNGGKVSYMEQGGELKTYWGGEAEIASENPYLPGTGETIEFKGDSHANGGIGVKFGKTPIEVEGGEPAVKLQDGKDESLVVFGDMKIPSYGVSELMDPKAKGKKFKNYVNDLNDLENKQNRIVKKGVEIVNDTPIIDSFDKLKMSSGKAMIEGGNMKLKQIAAKKQIAANVQNAILETAEELNLKSDELAKGKFKKAKYGTKAKNAQYGGDYINPIEEAVLLNQVQGTDPSLYNAFGNFNQYYPIPSGVRRGVSQPSTPQNRIPINTPKRKESPYFDNLPIQGDINTDYLNNVSGYGEIPQLAPLSQPPYQEGSGTPLSTPATTQGTPKQRGNFDWMTLGNMILPYVRPSNRRGLDPNQLSGERYALATNQLEPVQAQLYNPLLESVSDISLQDQLNANQSDFNSLKRLTAANPAAQSALAAQKYEANSRVLGEQFRQNQAQRMGVYNRNRGVLNDATLKNLAILDQQYVRQSQAKSNTKAVAQAAINSISDKIARNKLENRTLGVYENLYNYRFDNSGRALNWNGFAQFNVDAGIVEVDENGKVVLNESKVERDKYGIVSKTTETAKERQKRISKSSKNGGIVKAIKGY